MAPYAALVAILREPPPKDARGDVRLKRAFDDLRALADPRAADALFDFITTNPPPRCRTAAAVALGAIGDFRIFARRRSDLPVALIEQSPFVFEPIARASELWKEHGGSRLRVTLP
jgi:hypothetical protein